MPELLRDYELIVIAGPQLDDQGVVTFTERISGWITGLGGAVVSVNVWGRRALAYAIRKQREGIYVQFNCQLPPSASRDIERNLRIDEQVLRHMLIRADEA
jgi:small subunit ribosomal protein S6